MSDSDQVFNDVDGTPVNEGDVIAVARRDGNLAEIRTGEVIELFDDQYGRGKARVSWRKGRRLPQSKVTTIDWHSNRIVVVMRKSPTFAVGA